MANFEYIDEAETIAAQEVRRAAEENKTNVNSSEKTNYWEELLKDRYEVQKVEEFNALGKGKRSRKQVLVEEICFSMSHVWTSSFLLLLLLFFGEHVSSCFHFFKSVGETGFY